MHTPSDDLPLAPLLPPPDDPTYELLHTRDYAVQVYRVGKRELLARGAVRDLKPGGLYLPNDPVPLPVHHMVVELRVEFPSLTITSATVEFRVYPEQPCPTIVRHYESLAGLSIARGFTHKGRDLFGGPRGCTHTTALLQAMAPAVVQSTFSMQWQRIRDGEVDPAGSRREGLTKEQRRSFFQTNINTCHVWDEDGDLVASLEAGRPPEVPVFVRLRYAERGLDPETWRGSRPTSETNGNTSEPNAAT